MTRDAQSEFVRQHERLVHTIAQRLRAQMELTCDLDDLVAFGFEGLTVAHARFDPSRGAKFSTFAYYRIRGAILDGVRKMAYVSRRAHARLRAAEGVDDVLEQQAGVEAALPPNAHTAERAAEAIDGVLGKLSAAFLMSAVGQGEDDRPASPEDETLRAEVAERVQSAVRALPERERSLVEGFYLKGRRFDDVAIELGISKSWASRLHAKALGELRDALAELA